MSETVAVDARDDKTVIHRGPLPESDEGHHWFVGGDCARYAIVGGPGADGGNRGWCYDVLDSEGQSVDDSMFTLAEIRAWSNALTTPNSKEQG